MLHVNLETALRTKEGGKSSHLGSLLRLRCVFDLFCVRKKRVFSFSSICYFVVVLVVVCRSCLSCTSLFFFCCRLFVCFVFIALLVSRSTVHVVEEKRRAAFFFFLSALCTSRSAFFFFILEGAVVVTLRLVSLVRQSTGGTIEKNWSQLLFFLFFFS